MLSDVPEIRCSSSEDAYSVLTLSSLVFYLIDENEQEIAFIQNPE